MNQRLIDKLRKVLELTKSPVEGEAAAAAAILQKLLTEHNLAMADLEKKGGTDGPVMKEQGYDLGKAAFQWKLDLAEGIAEFYFCAPLVRGKSVKFVGRPDNVEALTMLYGWVIEQVKAIATSERRVHYDRTGEHIDPLRWQVQFGIGAVQRLIERLKELRARQQEDLARNEMGDVVALTVHHATEVSDYLEKKYGFREDGKPTKREQEWEEKWRRKAEAKSEMEIRCREAGDMGPYYEAYPEEHPDYLAEREKARLAEEKRYERNQRRREQRGPSYRRSRVRDYTKEDQGWTAQQAGHKAADKVNLQPFLNGSGPNKGEVGE